MQEKHTFDGNFHGFQGCPLSILAHSHTVTVTVTVLIFFTFQIDQLLQLVSTSLHKQSSRFYPETFLKTLKSPGLKA